MIAEVKSSEKGTLIAIDFERLPFTPKRTFYIGGVPDDNTRGCHAHIEGKQVLWCLSGVIFVVNITKSSFERTFHELRMGDCVFIDKMVWSQQTYYNEARALVLCSNSYDEADYIRDWKAFKA